MSNEWIPIDTVPMDGTKVMRWHRIWKCVVSVYYNRSFSKKENCFWVDATLSNSWPEEAFEPFWQPMVAGPGETSTTRQILVEENGPKGISDLIAKYPILSLQNPVLAAKLESVIKSHIDPS